jgi:glycyl-tRNA synthetase beta chain
VLLYGERIELGAEETVAGLQGFLGERVRHFFGGRGFGHDEIEAAMAVRRNNLPDLEARLRALHKVRGEVGFRSLVHAARRISNILEGAPEHELEPELLEEAAEEELHRAVTAVRERVEEAARERRYDDSLHHLLELVPPLDRFFAEVLVMDENENRRHNRIALLQSCRRLYWRIARLKEMMVEKAVEKER